MPVITKRKLVPVPVGIQCDRCLVTDTQGFNTFSFRHTMGFSSPSDMTTIEAALCDRCLLEIMLTQVPGAAFTDQEQRDVAPAEMRRRLEQHNAAYGKTS